MGSPFKKPPDSSAYPITFSSSTFHLDGVRDRGLQKGVNLLFLCPEEGCPKRGEPPFFWDLKPLLIPLTTEGAVRRVYCAPRRPLPAALYLQPQLTSGRRKAAAKATAADQRRSLLSSRQQHLDVRASAKPRPRAAAGLLPHDDLIAVGQWGEDSAGGLIAESRGRGRDPACWRHLVPAASAAGPRRAGVWGGRSRCSRP